METKSIDTFIKHKEVKKMENKTSNVNQLNKTDEQKPKSRPLATDYFAMGEGKGISVTVWSTHLQLQRRERDPNTNQWATVQEFSIAPMNVEKLFIRFPEWFRLMQNAREKKE